MASFAHHAVKKELLNVGRVKVSTHPHNSLPNYVPFCFVVFGPALVDIKKNVDKSMH